MTYIEIKLLGAFDVTVDGEPATGFATDKARALLAYLATEAQRPHRRDALAGLLWSEQPQKKARQSLRQALSHVRQAIGDSAEAPFLLVARESVQFNPDCDYAVDVVTFARLYDESRHHRHRGVGACRMCLAHLAEMVTLYRGDFMQGFYLNDSADFEEWTLLKREWHHLHVVEALTILGQYAERRGAYAQAQEYLQRQVAMEPWREEAHRQLMRLLVASGQRTAALRQYKKCRDALLEELGVEPTSETQSLFEQIRAQPAACGLDAVPGTPLSTRGPLLCTPLDNYTLPLAPTAFVGRASECAALHDLLANPDCRMVTLVGPGGIGKSRLGLQVAQEQVGLFRDGVVFISLIHVTDAGMLMAALVDEFNITTRAKNPQRSVLDYLRGKALLLVLDNFEQVAAGATFLSALLRVAPGIVLLLTSRERLNLREEWVYNVGGLAYVATALTEAPASEAGALPGALALFIQRARQAGARWPDEPLSYLPAVADICRLVEGSPLAIELAAALTVLRPCAEIAAEIAHNLDVLTTRLRNVPPRHRSLRATFEHSWQLLNQREQQVFYQLAVFRGGFSLDAARAVTQASAAILAALCDQSLLYQDQPGRYYVHQLLRQYAAEKLAAFPEMTSDLERQHSIFYTAFVAQHAEALKGPSQTRSLQLFALEMGNVRAAWQWARDRVRQGQDVARACAVISQAVDGLYIFYVTRGWYEEGTATFSDLVAVLSARLEAAPVAPADGMYLLLGRMLARQGKCCEFSCSPEDAQALFERSLAIFHELGAVRETSVPLHGLGYQAHRRGDYGQAREYFAQSLAVYEQNVDLYGVASVLNMLCLVSRREGQYADARQYCQQSLALRREQEDMRGMASTLNSLGLVLCALGEYGEAEISFEEGARLCRHLEYKIGLANTLTGLCRVAFRRGEPETAEQYAYEGLLVYQDIGDHWGVAIAYNNLGYMAMATAAYDRAYDFYQAAIAVYRQIGVKSGLANTLGNLGEVCLRRGNFDAARAYFLESLVIAQDIGELPMIVESLFYLALWLTKTGALERGLAILAWVRAHPSKLKATGILAETTFAQLSASLAPERVAAIVAQGEALALDPLVQTFREAHP